MIPYGKHSITDEDIAAVVDVLRSDYITQGNTVPHFEDAIAAYCEARHAVAVSSGTAALHLACLSLGLGPGDTLWTSPNTFVASANCARYCGADVDFVDIDPQTYNMSAEALGKKLEKADRDGCLPKIIVPVHFAGQPCDMKAIAELARRYGVYLIEDACHALGAHYEEKPVGTCEYSDITVFSFHPVKTITTGEGGVLLTNHDPVYERAKLLRSHGVERSGNRDWVYEQNDLGFNYRLTDIQAALGLSQLDRLDAMVALRCKHATRYNELLRNLPLILPYQSEFGRSSWHLYVIQLSEEAAVTRGSLYQMMQDAGIGVNVHYIPVHTQPYYQRLGFCPGQFPTAEAYYDRCLTLPLFPTLSATQQEEVVRTLGDCLE